MKTLRSDYRECRDHQQRVLAVKVKQPGSDSNEQEMYASLTRLGLDHLRAFPEEGSRQRALRDFRRRLLRADLTPERASEIKVILETPEVAAKFVNGDYKRGVREALEQARQLKANRRRSWSPGAPGPKPTAAPDEASRARRGIVRRLQFLLAMRRRAAGAAATPWTLACGLYEVSHLPAEPTNHIAPS